MRRSAPVVVLLALSVLTAIAGWPPPAAGAPVTLPDGTTTDRWTLPNGLRVVTRSVRESRVVAITIAYRFGRDDDPPNRRGLAQLLGQVGFMAPAGDLAGRRLEDLDAQRPAGWGFPVLRQVTLFSEGATVRQFPGVLAEMAQRMRGVNVDATMLRTMVKDVKRELGAQLEGPTDASAGLVAREAAMGRTNEEILALVSGRDLDALKAPEVSGWLRKAYNPSNAVLSLAGDLGTIDVRRLVDGLFASIPAGEPNPVHPPAVLQPGERTLARTAEATAAVGVIAPAIDDTTHPAFYLAVAAIGLVSEQVAHSNPARADWRGYDFGLFDEPEMGRLYPPIEPGKHTPENTGAALTILAQPMLDTPLLLRWMRMGRERVTYLMGGPMPLAVARSLKENPRMMIALSRAHANAELVRGPEFWDTYARRLESAGVADVRAMLERIIDPRFQVRVVLAPAAKPEPGSKQSSR